MAIRQDLNVIRGEDKVFTFNPAVAADVTGWTLLFTMTDEAGTVLVTQTPAVSAPTSGVFTVTLGAANTSSLHPGVYPYVVRRTDAGNAAVLALGDVLVEEQIPPP